MAADGTPSMADVLDALTLAGDRRIPGIPHWCPMSAYPHPDCGLNCGCTAAGRLKTSGLVPGRVSDQLRGEPHVRAPGPPDAQNPDDTSGTADADAGLQGDIASDSDDELGDHGHGTINSITFSDGSGGVAGRVLARRRHRRHHRLHRRTCRRSSRSPSPSPATSSTPPAAWWRPWTPPFTVNTPQGGGDTVSVSDTGSRTWAEGATNPDAAVPGNLDVTFSSTA